MAVEVHSHLARGLVAEWFAMGNAQRERSLEGSQRDPRERMVITISRQFGAGGHKVAALLAERLGEPWRVWDREIIDAIAESSKTRSRMVEALDERDRSWLEDALRSMGPDYISPTTYRQHLVAVLLTVARQGQKIIIGRGANFVLKEGLHVRLRASLQARLKETMAREKISREAAQKRLQTVDAERAAFTRNLFYKDMDDLDSYHMILRTDLLGYEGAVQAIIAASEAVWQPERSIRLPSTHAPEPTPSRKAKPRARAAI